MLPELLGVMNGVPARDKPSAFHHGLITQLVAELSDRVGDVDALVLKLKAAETDRDALREIVRRLVEWGDTSEPREYIAAIIADARKALGRLGGAQSASLAEPEGEPETAADDARKVLE